VRNTCAVLFEEGDGVEPGDDEFRRIERDMD